MADKEEQFAEGVVVEALPNALFNIELDSDVESEKTKITLAYLSGKMRIHRIKVLVGDRVKVKVDPYNGRGRIVQRLKF